MNLKTYTFESVEYSFQKSTRKWHFKFGTNQMLTACPGGKETADAVAKEISSGMKRSKKTIIDGIARKNIDKKLKLAVLD
jgi:hypothetical protein